MSKAVKVTLVEDDLDFAYLIQKLITKDERMFFLEHAVNHAAGVEAAVRLRPDVVVMDLNLSGSELDGIAAAKEIRLATDAKVVLLTSYEQPEIIIDASKRAFASGYVFKSQCTVLTDTIYKTSVSNTPQEVFIKELLLNELSYAERSVLNELLSGEVEAAAQSSQKTKANQKTSIFKKLGLRNTNELIHIFRNW